MDLLKFLLDLFKLKRSDDADLCKLHKCTFASFTFSSFTFASFTIQVFHLCLLEKAGNSFLFDSGKRLIVPLLAFTRMRVQAKNLDAAPWVPQVPNHQRIVDALRMGDPHLAEQIVIHIMSLFLKSALTVWAH